MKAMVPDKWGPEGDAERTLCGDSVERIEQRQGEQGGEGTSQTVAGDDERF